MPGRDRVPSFQLPSGTTDERDNSYNIGTVGNIFYNTDTSNVEIYHQGHSNNAAWDELAFPSCGAQMTSSGNGSVIIPTGKKSWFQDLNDLQIVSFSNNFSNNAPTLKLRSGSGGGYGFKINKSGYYELRGYFRFSGDFQISQSVTAFEFEDSSGASISTSSGNDRRTVPSKWVITNTASGGNRIARMNDYVMCSIKLNEGDCAYYIGNAVVNEIRAYESSLCFNIKYIASNVMLVS
jgi:hypothetical protein